MLAYLLLAAAVLTGQHEELILRHYTTEDGLPSSEVYATLTDKDGYLWVATDNGVARFDGYRFRSYDSDDGLTDAVVFVLLEDDRGTLWVSTISGKVFYLAGERFHEYAHNDVIRRLKDRSAYAHLVDVADDGSIIFLARSIGFIRIDSTGQSQKLNPDNQHALEFYDAERGARGRYLAHSTRYTRGPAASPGFDLYRVTGTGQQERIPDLDLRYKNTKTSHQGIGWFDEHKSGDTQAFFAIGSEVNYYFDGRWHHVRLPPKYRYVNYAMPDPTGRGRLLVMFGSAGGVMFLDFTQADPLRGAKAYLEGYSVSSGRYDENGGLWLTTTDDGLYYAPDPRQRKFSVDGNAQHDNVTSIQMIAEDELFYGTDAGLVHYLDLKTGQHRTAAIRDDDYVNRVTDLYYYAPAKRLYTGQNTFDFDLTTLRHQIGSYNARRFRTNPYHYPDELWMAKGGVLFEYDLRLKEPFASEKRRDVGTYTVEVACRDHAGRLLLGSVEALLEYREPKNTRLAYPDVPELATRVVDILPLANGVMAYGTRGEGMVVVTADTTLVIRRRNGLASNMVRTLAADTAGNIWVSTLNGISRVALRDGGAGYDLATYRLEHGLPTNEVYHTGHHGSQIWLATGEGVTRFVPPAADTSTSPPRIRQILLDGEEIPVSDGERLPAGPHDVSLQYGAIDFVLGDQVNYRYRIDDAADWQYTQDRTANYPNLGAGDYRFAVERQNRDGIWSRPARFSFTIPTPWYARWYTLLGAALLALAAVVAFFLVRERRRRREQELLLQITELEHAALHAQMNPHFVFNALNSILNFVLENKTKDAARYLTRFASVIRETLRASVDGKHRLDEELEMLDTYLQLEKLRFKDAFQYELQVSPGLPVREIVLPPLLIQPFVENAIVHGMKGRKRDGMILVHFGGTAEMLEVTIEDNGVGFDTTAKRQSDSLGMDITRRRLTMMNYRPHGESGMEVEPIYADDGQAAGTRVTLFITPLPTEVS